MGKTVLIPQYVPESLEKKLTDMGYTVVNGRGITEDEIIADIKEYGCEAIVARTAHYTRKIMEAARGQLKIIARYGVGLDAIDLKAAEENDIWVSFTPMANYTSVAELTVGLMLDTSRLMTRCISETRKGNFGIRNDCTGHDIMGRTVGILGFGKIGRTVGEICHKGFNMNVIAYDPYLTADKMPEWAKLADWDEVLKEADFVSCHMPLTEDTVHMISKREFQLMKPTAIFLNVARGGVVDEKELIEALKNKEIAGAGLDVTEKEPTEADNPLLAMDNVCITPHIAGLSAEAYERMADGVARCVDDVLTGHAPTYPANHLK